MAPRNKFTREEMIAAAVQIVRARGEGALTARSVAEALHVSTQPVFTCFHSMEELRREVLSAARTVYDSYVERGLQAEIPFFGFGMEYIRFAREEPELYRLLFLTGRSGGAMSALAHSQSLARESLMRIYRIDARAADFYFRDMWLVAHGLATLLVTGEGAYTDREVGEILTGFSLSLCRSIRQIPGFVDGNYDRNALFARLTRPEEEERHDVSGAAPISE